MIIESGHTNTVSNQKMEEFGLDNSNGQLFAVLSELYSNPVDSTIRELATNCNDAHILSNNELKPFIIKLPNPEKNIYNLCLRDFGPGLNQEQIFDIYRWYGRSTKTNDNNVTGCLGLGSKSPYSISSTFYVRSYYNGKCYQYTCTMGNNGKPGISEEPIIFETQEENGLEIMIPFYKEVNFTEIIPRVLKYFKVKPLVVKQMGELERDLPVNINWIQETKMKMLTDVIGIREEYARGTELVRGNLKSISNEVIQLQIYYPLDVNLIKSTIVRYNKLYTDESGETIKGFRISDYRIKLIDRLLDAGIHIYSKPGKIAFAPSRESIKYTDSTLIYIVKELIKATKIYERQFTTMFAYIDTYDKAFKSIYLGGGDYHLLKNKDLIIPTDNIKRFIKQFGRSYNFSSQELPPEEQQTILELREFMDLDNPSKHKSIMQYGHRAVNPCTRFNLESNRSDLNDLFNMGSRLRWFDLCDISGLDVTYNVNRRIVVSFMTPFMRELNRLCINKLFWLTYMKLKEVILEHMVEVYEMDDTAYTKYFDKGSSFISVHLGNDLNIPSEETFENGVLVPGFRQSKESFQMYYDRVNSYNMAKIIGSISRLFNVNHTWDKSPKYQVDKLVTILNSFIIKQGFSKVRRFPKEFENISDEELLNFLNTPNTQYLRYKDLEVDWTLGYRKFAKPYLKSKRIVSKIKDVNFDLFAENLVNADIPSFQYLHRADKLIPFRDIVKPRAKEVFDIEDLISQYCLYVGVKYYPEEFQKQIDLSLEPDDIKNRKVANILHKFNIPMNWCVNVKQIEHIPPPVRNTRSPRASTLNFEKVYTGSQFSDIKTNLYKVEEIPSEEIIAKKEELALEFLEEFENVVKNTIEIDNKIKKIFVDRTTPELVKLFGSRSVNNITRRFNSNTEYQYIISKVFKRVEDYFERKFKNVIVKYNAIHSLNMYLSRAIDSVNLRILDSGLVSMLEKVIDFPKMRTKDIIYININDSDGVSRAGFIERIEEVVEFEGIDSEDDSEDVGVSVYSHEIHMDYIDEWIYSRNQFPFIMDEEKAEQYYEEYFTTRKFVLLDPNIKIGVGINPVPEVDFQQLKRQLTDTKTKAARKLFNEKKTNIHELAKVIWPEYIFINDLDRIPSQYQKNVYNFIPLLMTLNKSDKFKELFSLFNLLKSMVDNTSYQYLINPTDDLVFGKHSYLASEFDKFYTDSEEAGLKFPYRITESVVLNGYELLKSGGKLPPKKFKDAEKFIGYFGNTRMVRNYKKDIEQRYKVLYDTFCIYLEIFKTPREVEDFKDLEELFISNHNFETTCKQFSKKIENLLKDMNTILILRNTYCNIINDSLDAVVYRRFMPTYEKHGKDRFKKFIDSLGTYLFDIKSKREFNVSNMERMFKNYLKPQIKKPSLTVNGCKDVDNLIIAIEDRKKTEQMHRKINSRTKANAQTKEMAKEAVQRINNTLDFISKL